MRLSEKHGLNPALVRCAWCGEDTGEIACLGKLPGDAEAPKRVVTSYEPCPKCKEKWDEGIVCIEVVDYPTSENQPPIQKDLYPTGRVGIADADLFNKQAGTNYRAGQRVLMTSEAFEGGRQ